jgi:hypothetical protein
MCAGSVSVQSLGMIRVAIPDAVFFRQLRASKRDATIRAMHARTAYKDLKMVNIVLAARANV